MAEEPKVYTLGVLKEVEALIARPLYERFDLVFSTSIRSGLQQRRVIFTNGAAHQGIGFMTRCGFYGEFAWVRRFTTDGGF